MILPDFTGMSCDQAKQILDKGFPEVSCHFHTYISPKLRKEKEPTNASYLVIRQRIIGQNQLELTISPFSMMNK